MSTFPRLVLLPLVGAFGGFAAIAPAGAQTAPPSAAPSAADLCATAFDAPTDPRLQMAMDPAPRSDATPGQLVRLSASWAASQWDSLSAVVGCVEVDGALSDTLSGLEDPPVDDGAFEHRYNVPNGLFNGTVICHRTLLSGDPVGEATSATWVSKQGCVEVHPQESEPPPPTSTPTAPPAGSAAESPAPPAHPAAPQPPAATPTPVASHSAPQQPGETTGKVPPPLAGRPADGVISPAPGSGPIELPELPRTGAAPLALVWVGAVSIAAGLTALLLGRRGQSLAVVKATRSRG